MFYFLNSLLLGYEYIVRTGTARELETFQGHKNKKHMRHIVILMMYREVLSCFVW